MPAGLCACMPFSLCVNACVTLCLYHITVGLNVSAKIKSGFGPVLLFNNRICVLVHFFSRAGMLMCVCVCVCVCVLTHMLIPYVCMHVTVYTFFCVFAHVRLHACMFELLMTACVCWNGSCRCAYTLVCLGRCVTVCLHVPVPVILLIVLHS